MDDVDILIKYLNDDNPCDICSTLDRELFKYEHINHGIVMIVCESCTSDINLDEWKMKEKKSPKAQN